jgi:hypothetical protein
MPVKSAGKEPRKGLGTILTGQNRAEPDECAFQEEEGQREEEGSGIEARRE